MQSKSADYPALERHTENVFVVVKTYPHPSPKYRELVCTAGLTEKGKWIRLYPIGYRYMDFYRRYSKYQWIEVEIEKNKEDFRIDSYRPFIQTLKLLGEPLSTKKDGWQKRKEIILPTAISSLEEIQDLYESDGISLGIFKPKEIIDFTVESADSEWSPKQEKVLAQLRLFETQPKQLDKIPFKFIYKFTCHDAKCKKLHKLSIIDWEIFQLYRNIKNNYQYDMATILQKIKEKYFDEICNSKRDTYLIVGSRFPSPTFMVLGIFWPPK